MLQAKRNKKKRKKTKHDKKAVLVVILRCLRGCEFILRKLNAIVTRAV